MSFVQGSISEQCKKMEHLGINEGGSLRPSSDATMPDINEVKVIRLAKQFVEIEQSDRTNEFVQCEKKINEIDHKIDVIDASFESVMNDEMLDGVFQAALSKEENNLIASCSRELEARSALNRFKTINQLHDPAYYPKDQLLHISYLILFIVIETICNAAFYKSESGYLGGAVIALSVSVATMLIAAALGFTFRFVNLPTTKDKIKGYVAFVSFIVLAFVLNLIFATFRVQYVLLQEELLEKGYPNASPTQLIQTLKAAIAEAVRVFTFEFPQIDMDSLILFIVGIMFSCIAAWKGYTLDDKHPGYGQIDRRHKVAENEFNQLKEQVFNDALSKVHKISEEVEIIRAELISLQKNSIAIKANLQSAQASFDGNLKKIQSELGLVIEAYREANKATRTIPAPKYFDELPIVLPADDHLRLDHLLSLVENLSTKSKAIADDKLSLLSNRLQTIRSKINVLIQKEFQTYISYIGEKANETFRAKGIRTLND